MSYGWNNDRLSIGSGTRSGFSMEFTLSQFLRRCQGRQYTWLPPFLLIHSDKLRHHISFEWQSRSRQMAKDTANLLVKECRCSNLLSQRFAMRFQSSPILLINLFVSGTCYSFVVMQLNVLFWPQTFKDNDSFWSLAIDRWSSFLIFIPCNTYQMLKSDFRIRGSLR